MSVALMSAVWRITFPTQSQKLIALKLADHANDEGGNVWPSKASLAHAVGCSERIVQYSLKAMRAAGLLRLVDERPGKTPIYELNADLLLELARTKAELGGGQMELILPQQGGADPARVRGADPAGEGSSLSAGEGSSYPAPEPSLNHQETPLRAHAHTREARSPGKVSNLGEVKREPLTRFDLTSGDVAWKAWVAHLENLNRQDLIEAATKAGAMTVFGSRWPKDGAPLPRIGELAHAAAKTDRIVGSK